MRRRRGRLRRAGELSFDGLHLAAEFGERVVLGALLLAALEHRLQVVAVNSDLAGAVTVLLYDEASQQEAAYADTVDGMLDDHYPVEGLGEQARMSQPMNLLGAFSVETVFRRCRAVVHIRMFAPDSPTDVLTTYAKRLDQRLAKIVC